MPFLYISVGSAAGILSKILHQRNRLTCLGRMKTGLQSVGSREEHKGQQGAQCGEESWSTLTAEVWPLAHPYFNDLNLFPGPGPQRETPSVQVEYLLSQRLPSSEMRLKSTESDNFQNILTNV